MIFSVAIDGPAGAGKGTIADYISEKFKLRHLDTGLLYREAARLVIENNVDISDENSLEEIAQRVDAYHLNPEKLRNETVAAVASKIAVAPSLREILTQKMRDFANNVDSNYAGVVLDGRDVGTVILPNANVKIYVTADAEVRAIRRSKELDSTALERILADIKIRDERDQNRKTAPLEIAQGAVVLDTTFLNIEAACEQAASIVGIARN